MRVVERFVVAVVILMSGLLVFVSASRSWEQKARVTAADSNDCQRSPAANTVSSSSNQPASSFVANPFCKACHLDFDEEELALNHEIFGIGCERCHGESLRHRSDEANVTPPELMYPKERVNPMCMMCHPRQDLRDRKDHLPILEAGLSVFEEMTPSGADAKKYCTDCHGSKHRIMKVRTVRWDKGTGALLKKGD
jgi:cytochrome c5